MCGIAGILHLNPRPLDAIFAMNAAQEHRGPDGEGYLFINRSERYNGFSQSEVAGEAFGNLAFGHRRLAILDTSDAGLQPMASNDGQIWVLHNGEVYNYLELRTELQRKGHTFETGTDTEVVIAAYREWGVDCFTRFNGMWGMAIWDHRRGQLILSRDRFGIKPLHICRIDDGLIFASEIKGVLAAGHIKPKLNPAAAAQFLKWSNVNTTSETMFDGIESLPAGHLAVIDIDRPMGWSSRPFYDLQSVLPSGPTNLADASREFREIFLSSVELRMRSDVPVGSCLSGGLDSSSVVCAATNVLRSNSSESGSSLDTFTSAFIQPDHDERRWSDLVNGVIGSTPHTIMPTAEEFENDFMSVVWHQDEPFPSTSIFAQWRVMQAARQSGVPVLLDGQGGDETLCGYRKYYFFYLQSLIRQRRLIKAVSEAAGLVRNGDTQQWNWRVGGGSRYLPSPLQSKVWSLTSVLAPGFRSDWDDAVGNLGLGGGTIAQRQVADVQRFSVPPLLRYEDRNSMAWSVETRVPFMDHRLVEFAVGLPDHIKLSGGRTKSVLRNGLRGLVPDAVLDRKSKLGFNSPMTEWLSDELKPLVERRLSRSDFAASGVVDPKLTLAAFQDRSPSKDFDSLSKIFRVFALDAWMERFEVQL